MATSPFYKTFNLKDSHFINDWADIDTVSLKDLQHVVRLNWCQVNCNHISNSNSVLCLDMKDDIFAFGKIHKNGTIILEGVQGFPFDPETSKIIDALASKAKSKRIDSKYVFVEW